MSDTPFVTVGVPTMNNAETIEETLETLVKQSRRPDKIIIVDASDDATPELVRAFAEASSVQIELYEQSDRGRGVGAARQDIYERFAGDLLACLDTNRRVNNDWLERRVEFHRRNPDVDILSSSSVSGLDGPVENPKRGYFFQQANCTIRRAALDKVNGWDPWFPRGEDWDIQIRLWRSGASTYVDSTLHGESIIDESGFHWGKALNRPSSVAFLRKYGWWYLRFHPEHPAGDAASCISIVLLLLLPVVTIASPLAGVASACLILLLSSAYLYLHNVRHRSGFELRYSDAADILRFLILGYTAIREYLAGSHPWNYAGLHRSES